MSEGEVNFRLQAVVELRLVGPTGRRVTVEATVDTGFSEFLTLSPTEIHALSLQEIGQQQVALADGSQASLAIHRAIVEWEGTARTIPIYATDADPLLGMAMLRGHSLFIEVEVGGRVAVEAL